MIEDQFVTPEYEYLYGARGINQNGFGEFSGFTSGTNYTLPSAPTNLSVDSTGTTHLNLSWTAPSDDGGTPITGYRIQRESPIGDGWSTLITDTGNTNTSYNNTILLSATQYNYRVAAINSVGLGPYGNSAYNWTQPEAPINPSAAPKAKSANQINLEWTAPSGTVTGYLIEYETPPGNGWIVLEANYTGGLYYNHTGLAENTTYNYRIAAITNPVGPYSPPFNATTGDAPDPPTSVTATIIDPDSDPLNILVSWVAPADIGDNTVITGYDIIRSVNGGAYVSLVNDTAGLTYNDLTVVLNTNYTYAVGAKGDVIDGNFSAASNTVLTPNTPDAPTGVNLNIPNPDTLPYQINVSWSAPGFDGGSAVTGYTVWRSTDDVTYVNVTATGSSPYLDTVPSVPGQIYYYKIAATNLLGTGTNSTSSNITVNDVPTAPTSLQVIPKRDNVDFTLSWNTPVSDGGSPIVGYQIQRNPDGAGWTTVVANTGNTATTYTDTGLASQVSYQYRVYAINIHGGSPASSIVTGEFSYAELTPTITPLSGSIVRFEIDVNMTYGIPTTDITDVWLKEWDTGSRVDTIETGLPISLSKGSTTNFTLYDTFDKYETRQYYIQVRTENGEVTQFRDFITAQLQATPQQVFTGHLMGLEYRNSTFTGSVMEVTGQPQNFDLVAIYSEKNNLDNKFVLTWENVEAEVNYTSPVLSTSDYYVSLYYNPTFNYTIGASPEDGTATIPIAYPIDLSLISLGDPNLKGFDLGIDVLAGESGIFGLPLVFIFIIALASIFTGRSAPMGIIFIGVALGMMAYLGLIDFNFDPANQSQFVTWALIIIAIIVGVMVGKRWD